MKILVPLLLVGSLLYGGIARADEDLDLNHAITDLNGSARLPYARWSIYAVIALQTNVRVGTLMADRKTSHLDYGELLVVESLASATGKPLPALVAQKEKTQSWAKLSRENGINPGSLTLRLRAAMDSMHIAERIYHQQRPTDMNLKFNHNLQQSPPQKFSSTAMRQPMIPPKNPRMGGQGVVRP